MRKISCIPRAIWNELAVSHLFKHMSLASPYQSVFVMFNLRKCTGILALFVEPLMFTLCKVQFSMVILPMLTVQFELKIVTSIHFTTGKILAAAVALRNPTHMVLKLPSKRSRMQSIWGLPLCLVIVILRSINNGFLMQNLALSWLDWSVPSNRMTSCALAVCSAPSMLKHGVFSVAPQSVRSSPRRATWISLDCDLSETQQC